MMTTRNRIIRTATLAAHAMAVILAAACWQVAGIDVIDLPVRDGDEDAEDFEAEGDDADVEASDDDVQPDQAEVTDPLIDDLPVEDVQTEDSIPTIDLQELCGAYQMVRCSYMESCCTDQDRIEFRDFLAAYQCDVPGDSPDFNACMDAYGESVNEGKILLAESGFLRCESAIMNLLEGECPGWGRFDRRLAWAIELDCVDLFVGTVAAGEACRFRAECAGSSCCVEGVCKSCLSPDGGCEGNESCPVGQRCIGNECTSPAGNSEPCDFDDEQGVSDCLPDFWCGGEACEPLQESGGHCTADGTFLPFCTGLCVEDGMCRNFCGL